MSSNIINLVDDDEDYDINNTILYRISKKEQLYDIDKVPMDKGKTAYIYRAKNKNKDVVVRIIYGRFPQQITPIEWKNKKEMFDLLNKFPNFFPHIYSWGVDSLHSSIINTEPQSNISYKVYYEILEYIPTETIPKTRDALFSLYDFLHHFWKTGFIHGDLTISNIRFYGGKWVFIDLDSIRYIRPDADKPAFSFTTPNDFYCNGKEHRDHNNFTIIIDSISQWKSIIKSCKREKEQKNSIGGYNSRKKSKRNKKNIKINTKKVKKNKRSKRK